MRKLVIDIGNTRVKTAVFNGKEMETQESFPVGDMNRLQVIVEEQRPYPGSILSTVRDYPVLIHSFLKQYSSFIELTETTPLPIQNSYETPATLGKDRLAAACGGHALFPGQDVLVVNTGTCITYDVVHADGIYLGGSISPGLNMRLKALHTFTGRLPLLSPDDPTEVPGKNTPDSILTGALLGAIEEVNGMISRYHRVFPELRVVLSGGDASFFENQLKSGIFVTPNIVLLGLNEIFDYNALP